MLKRSVLLNRSRIAYIDLFAGPGRYRDGAASAPLLILQKAIADDFLREHLVAMFNDKDENNTQTLEREIRQLPGIDSLKNPPKIMRVEVDEGAIAVFESIKLVPTLSFVDPWGYKGLSLKLINSIIKDCGCDCIFFFHYNIINMGLNNTIVKEHMDALFGVERAEELRRILAPLSPIRRELTIVETISEALKEMGGRHVLPFTFKNADGTRTSHYLIFVSKHVRGYEIMKDIMARASSYQDQGVASFSYCPGDESTPLLMEFARPLSGMGEMLLRAYAGRTLTMQQVYDGHHVDRPFIKKNYKDVLTSLELAGKIEAYPPAPQRVKRKGVVTFADDVRVCFPESWMNG